MNYKKEIIEMVQDIHSAKILDLIYWFVKRGDTEKRKIQLIPFDTE